MFKKKNLFSMFLKIHHLQNIYHKRVKMSRYVLVECLFSTLIYYCFNGTREDHNFENMRKSLVFLKLLHY